MMPWTRRGRPPVCKGGMDTIGHIPGTIPLLVLAPNSPLQTCSATDFRQEYMLYET